MDGKWYIHVDSYYGIGYVPPFISDLNDFKTIVKSIPNTN